MTSTITPFTFDTPPALIMDWGGAGRLGPRLADSFAARRVLIVTDSFLNRSGALDAAITSLTDAGFAVTVFDDVVADPPEAVVLACAAMGKTTGCDIVLGLGGGSSLDVAKLAAVLMVSDQDLPSLYGIGKVTGTRLPLVQMPTTSGTGSEMTNITILTRPDHTKMGVVARQLYADLVVLDAALTVGLPPVQTAATGIDAMVHAIEAYTSRLRKNPMSDGLARTALRLLADNLLAACADGSDRAAREGMMLGASLAGQAFANSPVAAVHALAYPLGGHYGLPHGLTNALMLAPVLRFNMAAAAPLYAELADATFGPGQGDVATRAQDFVMRMCDLLERSGAPLRLRDVGVPEADLPLLARDAMLQQRLLVNNPVPVTEEDALHLYQSAYSLSDPTV